MPFVSQDGNRYKFEHDNPFLDEDEEDEVAPVGYRYRKWCLGNDINLVARTEHDAVQSAPNNEIQFINIKVHWQWLMGDLAFCCEYLLSSSLWPKELMVVWLM